MFWLNETDLADRQVRAAETGEEPAEYRAPDAAAC